jgi:hypothetical protein
MKPLTQRITDFLVSPRSGDIFDASSVMEAIGLLQEARLEILRLQKLYDET